MWETNHLTLFSASLEWLKDGTVGGSRSGVAQAGLSEVVNRMRVSYAIVFVSDMKRSVAFYRDVIGLPLKFDSPEWSEFATDGATLALHRC